MRVRRTSRARVTLRLGLALAALWAGGCALLAPQPSVHRQTDAGTVEMDWVTRRHLRIVRHAWRRDPGDRLVASVVFRNVREDEYLAEICTAFRDAEGEAEVGPAPADTQRFPPGETRIEWSSYSADAAEYRIDVSSGRAFQW